MFRAVLNKPLPVFTSLSNSASAASLTQRSAVDERAARTRGCERGAVAVALALVAEGAVEGEDPGVCACVLALLVCVNECRQRKITCA